MSMEKKIFKTFSIQNTLDLGDSSKKRCRNTYIILNKENYHIGVDFGQAFVYLDEKGLHRLYYKIVSSIKNLYHDNDYLIPIHGSLNSVIYLEPLTIIVLSEREDKNRLLVLHRNFELFELDSIVKGFLSKKTCYISDIEIGFSGEQIIGVAKTTGDRICRDLLIIGRRFDSRFKYVEEDNLIPQNWNGQWYSYLKIGKKDVEHIVILYNNKKLKYVLDKKLYGSDFLIKNTMVYYGFNNNIAVLSNGRELKAIDLDNEKILWQKIFDKNINIEVQNMYLDEIVYYSGSSVFVQDIVDNRILFNEKYSSNISSAYITEDYLVIGFNNKLFIYERKGKEYIRIGKYSLPGTIVNIHVSNRNMIVSYLLPNNILKAIYVNLSDTLDIELSDITMSVNTAVELNLNKYRASVKLIDEKPLNIEIVDHMGKTYIAETSGLPGVYNVYLNIDIPGYLPLIADININVKSIEKIIRKIIVPNKPTYSIRGAYIPVTIDLESSIDELYIVMTNRDKTVYGSTNLITNVNPGEVTIPLYITWAKRGEQEVDLIVTAWTKRNKILQKYSALITFERDIPLLYCRVFSDTVYLWSPIDLGIANITTVTGDYRVEMKQSISKGWNEIETLKGDFDELIVILPSKVKYVSKRGRSWIEFLK
uniref:Uncharacterized protein n=1 Tax=Staphylothermus marinus TaxID=2280 RepID=A0A7C4D818_STAMA